MENEKTKDVVFCIKFDNSSTEKIDETTQKVEGKLSVDIQGDSQELEEVLVAVLREAPGLVAVFRDVTMRAMLGQLGNRLEEAEKIGEEKEG